MLLEIVQYGNAVLREKCKPIRVVDESVEALARDMIETMVGAEGVGLAAPQVGVPVRLAVVDVSTCPESVSYFRVDGKDEDVQAWMPLVFYNPEVSGDGEVVPGKEGCLSIEGIRAEVSRPGGVKARLRLLDGRCIELETDGLLARAIQHETDHLDGILFIDRLPVAKKALLRGKLRKLRAHS